MNFGYYILFNDFFVLPKELIFQQKKQNNRHAHGICDVAMSPITQRQLVIPDGKMDSWRLSSSSIWENHILAWEWVLQDVAYALNQWPK